jgi:hypothetical protein
MYFVRWSRSRIPPIKKFKVPTTPGHARDPITYAPIVAETIRSVPKRNLGFTAMFKDSFRELVPIQGKELIGRIRSLVSSTALRLE